MVMKPDGGLVREWLLVVPIDLEPVQGDSKEW
jgi:hypothetical protein